MTGRKITLLALFVALFSSILTTEAFAGYVQLNTEIEASSTPSTLQLKVDTGPMFVQANGSLIANINYTKSFQYDVRGSEVHCGPQQGGASSVDEFLYYTILDTYQVDNGSSDCTAPGTYYITYATLAPNRTFECSTKDCFYASYVWDGTAFALNEAPIGDIYTFINQPSPYGVTTASTSVPISVTYKVSAGFNFEDLPAYNIGYRIYDAVTNELELEYSDPFDADTALFFTYTDTINLTSGSKIMRAFIENAETGIDLAVEDDTFFNVVTNTYVNSTGIENPRSTPGALTQINCTSFDVGCQFQKALTFLFVPSQDVLNRYNSLWQSIRYKVPFGYVSVVIDQLGALDDTATPAFDLGDLPFMSTVFTPFRDALALILWGIFAIYFYQHRLTKLDI